ncbi:site-specific DNA-methyltransferase [uncultured Paludibaculum sp.]|uniref:site-specific DNA-methyltransferase n=1 Tax=uncultured Paludibaculum sp. TaxID=1765020 RepID=UPI002AAC1B96|nr:site-specific DNA-methyltransferase [uncultured Paludibaculum sp.]
MTDLQVVRWPVERLIPYARNARTHNAEQVAQIAASIAEFGWTSPILAGSDRIIIAGHARLQAARKLGMTEVPVIILDHLSEAQRRALVIADNRLALNAGWDEEMLRVELDALREDDFNLELLGFADDEIEALLAEPVEPVTGNTDDDAVPETPETAVTVPGDVWLLGGHRLLCGDATQMEAVEKVLARGLADMVFTDPPYNVNYGATMKDKLRGKKRAIKNDNLGDGFEQFLRDACTNLLAVTKGAVYICMSSSELHTLQKTFREAGGHWSTFVIWAKNTFTMGRSDYQRQYEPILYGWKEGTEHFWCGARDQGDVWFVKKPVVNDLHPTMKPVELIERAIRNSSKSRDTVLDPFGGSGSTLIACEKTGRQARLIELEPKYCDVVVRRFQEFSGKQANLETDGRKYAELAAERLGVAA